MKRIPEILMFGLLWAMLLMNRSGADQTGIRPLTEYLDAQSAGYDQRRTELLNYYYKENVRPPGKSKFGLPYYRLMLRVADTFQSIQQAFAAMEQRAGAASGYKRIDRRLQAGIAAEALSELRRLRAFRGYFKDYFEPALSDAFGSGLKSLTASILGRGDSADEAMRRVFRMQYGDDVIATLSVIRHNLLVLEKTMLFHIFIEGDRGVWSCSFENAFAIPDAGWTTSGSPVRAHVFVASYNKSPVIEGFAASTGTLRLDDGVLTWRGQARELGWNVIRGHTLLRLSDSLLLRRPWSFRYFCMPAFATVQLRNKDRLYRGIASRVQIEGRGRYPPGTLGLRAIGATVTLEDSSYSIVPEYGRRELSLRLLYHHGTQTDTLETRRFRVSDPPLPVLKIGISTDAGLDARQLREAGRISALAADPDLDAGYAVTGFRMRIENGRGDETGVYEVTGADFHNNAKLEAVLRSLQSGDRIFIENAQVSDDQGRILRPADRYYRLR